MSEAYEAARAAVRLGAKLRVGYGATTQVEVEGVDADFDADESEALVELSRRLKVQASSMFTGFEIERFAYLAGHYTSNPGLLILDGENEELFGYVARALGHHDDELHALAQSVMRKSSGGHL